MAAGIERAFRGIPEHKGPFSRRLVEKRIRTDGKAREHTQKITIVDVHAPKLPNQSAKTTNEPLKS